MAAERPAKRRCSADDALRLMAESARCSITGGLLADPVSAADGHVYEREAITKWLATHNTSPNTGAVLPRKELVALPMVRAIVQQLVSAGALAEDEITDWLLRMGVLAAVKGNQADAKDLLSRALAMGSVHAGYHYGILLVREAAEAGMPEALAARARLDAAPAAHRTATRLYAIGGTDDAGRTVEFFDLTTQAWMAAPEMSVSRYDSVAAVLGGKLYVAGGFGVNEDDNEDVLSGMACFDLATHVWTAAPAMSTERDEASAGVLGGKLYVVGGMGFDATALSSMEYFDPATQAWTAAPAMSTGRHCAAAAVLGGKLYVAGGLDIADAELTSVECFDPTTQAWTAAPAMSTARWGAAAAVLDGKLYVAGGMCVGAGLKSVECFDPATQTWTTIPEMSTQRHKCVAGVLGGKLYVMGGEETERNLSSVECFDPATHAWAAAPDMSMARSAAARVCAEEQ